MLFPFDAVLGCLVELDVIGAIQDAWFNPSGRVGIWTQNTGDGNSEWPFKNFTINVQQ